MGVRWVLGETYEYIKIIRKVVELIKINLNRYYGRVVIAKYC